MKLIRLGVTCILSLASTQTLAVCEASWGYTMLHRDWSPVSFAKAMEGYPTNPGSGCPGGSGDSVRLGASPDPTACVTAGEAGDDWHIKLSVAGSLLRESPKRPYQDALVQTYFSTDTYSGNPSPGFPGRPTSWPPANPYSQCAEESRVCNGPGNWCSTVERERARLACEIKWSDGWTSNISSYGWVVPMASVTSGGSKTSALRSSASIPAGWAGMDSSDCRSGGVVSWGSRTISVPYTTCGTTFGGPACPAVGTRLTSYPTASTVKIGAGSAQALTSGPAGPAGGRLASSRDGVPESSEHPEKSTTAHAKASGTATLGLVEFQAVRCPPGTTFTSSTAGGELSFPCESEFQETKGIGSRGTLHQYEPPKNTDCGNPCNVLTGNKRVEEVDFTYDRIRFTRNYNSLRELPTISGMGQNWTHNYSQHLVFALEGPNPVSPNNERTTLLPNATGGQFGGQILYQNERNLLEKFRLVSVDEYRSVNTDDVLLRRINDSPVTWMMYYPDGHTATFDLYGRLTKLSYPDDPMSDLTLTYLLNADYNKFAPGFWRIAKIQTPSNRGIRFEYVNDPASLVDERLYRIFAINPTSLTLVRFNYDSDGRLTSVDYPYTVSGHPHQASARARTYVYGEPANIGYSSYPEEPRNRHLLTGIIDENGVRFATYKYDALDRAVSTGHAGGAETYTLAYNAFETAVNHPSGFQTLFLRGDSEFAAPAQVKRYRNAGDSVPESTSFMLYNNDASSRLTDLQTAAPGITVTCDRADTYDSRICARTDRQGNVTTFGYDGRRLKSITEAVGKPEQRTAAFTYIADNTKLYRLQEVKRTHLNGVTVVTDSKVTFTYNTRNQIQTRTETDPVTNATRVWTYGYCESVSAGCTVVGTLSYVDGPRSDVVDRISYAYWGTQDFAGCSPTPCNPRGGLKTITNALGQVTTINSYDVWGRPTQITDPNGTKITLSYDTEGHLWTKTVFGKDNTVSTDDAVTTYLYDKAGLLKTIVTPEDTLTLGYDDAHRLTSVTDVANQSITYTLDADGNRTNEDVKDTNGGLRHHVQREFDTLGNLYRNILSAPGGTSTFGYDKNGNLKDVEDGRQFDASNQFDALDRLTQNTARDGGISKFEYDSRDNLVKVTDPRNLQTTYVFDGLNNLKSLTSPDTGTKTYSNFNPAGLPSTVTDARGIVGTFAYDALGRVTSESYTSEAYTFAYDTLNAECVNADEKFPVGNVTAATDPAGSTKFCYDHRGNLKRKIRVTGTGTSAQTYVTQWSYTLADRVATITYPSGTVVTYVRSSGNRIYLVAATPPGGSQTIIVFRAEYEPFGPVKSIKYGLLTTFQQTRTLDQNYWPDTFTSSKATGLTQAYGNDQNGNIIALTKVAGQTLVNFGYDEEGRFSQYQATSSPTPSTYGYDDVGNRLTRAIAPGVNETYGYEPQSNRLTSVTRVSGGQTTVDNRSYDNAGNTVTMRGMTLTYNKRGRLDTLNNPSVASAVYRYDPMGVRASKQVTNAAGNLRSLTHFAYDDALLLGERNSSWNPANASSGTWGGWTDYIYLNNEPVGMIVGGLEYYVESDHLGTPRRVMNIVSGVATWSWEPQADGFGATLANADPDGDGSAMQVGIRFPGQYFDAESGLHYNYFRDYDPSTGRYIQSDPIGLAGGINTYAYIGGNPLRGADPFGLMEITAQSIATGSSESGRNISDRTWVFGFNFTSVAEEVLDRVPVSGLGSGFRSMKRVLDPRNLTKPAGPKPQSIVAPDKRVQCDALDSKLKADYLAKFHRSPGYSNTISREQALEFLNEEFAKHKEMREFYVDPERMLDISVENGKKALINRIWQ